MMAAKRRIFESVFKNTYQISQPTPEIGFTAPGQPFGGPAAFAHDRAQAPESASRAFRQSVGSQTDINDQATWDRSWHVVTTFLTKPLTSGEFGFGAETPLPVPSPAFQVALMDTLDSESRLPGAEETEDLTSWYLQQVRYHFLHDVLPILSQASDSSKPEAVLRNCIRVLDKAHSLYLHGLSLIVRQLDTSKPGSSKSAVENFRRDLHALVGNSTSARVLVAVKQILAAKVDVVLGVPVIQTIHLSNPNKSDPEDARGELLALVDSLHNFGLGGERLKIIFAEVMNEAMSKYVQHTFGRIWARTPPNMEVINSDTQQSAQDTFVTAKSFGDSQNFSSAHNTSRVLRDANKMATSQCVTDLCDWIEDHYSTLALQVLGKMETAETDWNHVEKWKKMSTNRLAGLRTQELFDIVVNWPNSEGALDDLRTAIDTPQRRLQLTDVFLASLKERLLHPGASTLQILRTYISMIWSFHSLDHSKVLLDRVAYPLQVYLCSREDTVKIIITGLLSDTEDVSGAPIEPGGDKLVELAILLNKDSGQLEQRLDEDLDWDDMDWMPDPVDAGPGYKRSKNADVIGTLIGVLGSQEVFIKEFQNIVGDNLLKSDGDFDKEIKVLELLKTRFGEAPLQSCEVMIKDIIDSRRVNGVIRRNQKLDPSEQEVAASRSNSDMLKDDYTNPEGLLKPSLHAKILSRLFWPQLQNEEYRVPEEITQLQQRYEQGFEALKNSRKLTWLHSLGQATVELELSDRFILEEVPTWQATVIWAFQSDSSGDNTVTRTVQELVDKLEMDEGLLRSALTFWTSKMVLREVRLDEYTVLETLNQEDLARSNAQASAASSGLDTTADDAALISSDNITSEKMQMYWQFIQGMLTNSSPQMALQQIAMMLKMLIADGFPYSNEELQEFLGSKVADGSLELVKGKYKLKK